MTAVFRVKFACIVLGLASLSVAAPAKPESRLLPVDEAERDASLVEFREQLLMAIGQRSRSQLLRLTDPAVIADARGASGHAALQERWQLNNQDSEFWGLLEELLTQGGGFLRSEQGVQFCAPYVYTHFPDDHHVKRFGAIVRDHVVLKAEPDTQAKDLALLSYHIVEVGDWSPVAGNAGSDVPVWVAVRTADDVSGYVPATAIRNPLDFHVCFLRNRDRWKLASVLSGLEPMPDKIEPPAAIAGGETVAEPLPQAGEAVAEDVPPVTAMAGPPDAVVPLAEPGQPVVETLPIGDSAEDF